jgi:hypothetical protein
MARLPPKRPSTTLTTALDDPSGDATQVEADGVSQGRAAGLALLVGMCLAFKSVRPAVTPYVSEVNATEVVCNVGPAEVSYVPTDAAMARQVRECLSATRGLSPDPVVLHRPWAWAFAVVTARGGQQLAAYGALTERSPKTRSRTRRLPIIQSISIYGMRCLHGTVGAVPLACVIIPVQDVNTTMPGDGRQAVQGSNGPLCRLAMASPCVRQQERPPVCKTPAPRLLAYGGVSSWKPC